MKNNRTIRRVKCIRPAARLVNSGPNTTQSLPFSDHLIQLSSSVWPAARQIRGCQFGAEQITAVIYISMLSY